MKQTPKDNLAGLAFGLLIILTALILVSLTGGCTKTDPGPAPATEPAAAGCDHVFACIEQLQAELAAEAAGSRTAGSGMDAVDTTHLTNLYVADDVSVVDDLDVGGDLGLTGSLDVGNNVDITGQLTVTRDALFASAVEITGTLDVTGQVTFADNLLVAGDITQGDGTPDITQDGEDAYIEGTLEVDGAAQFDGNLDLNGSDLIIDADGDSILQEATDDNVTLTLGAAAGTHSVLTGNFKVGNGTPAVAQDGEDAYVEGVLEVGELIYLPDYDGAPAGGIVFGDDTDAALGWANASDALAVNVRTNCQAGDACSVAFSTVSTGTLTLLYGNHVIGDGTPDVAQDGEDAYIEGTFELDGAARFDSTFDIRGDLWDGAGDFTIADNVVITGTLDAQGVLFDSAGDFTIADAAVITSTLNVNGATDLDGTLNVDGLATFNEDTTIVSNLTVSATTSLNGDVTLAAEPTGGNTGAKYEFIGLPRIKLVGLAAGTNGTTETTAYVDDDPTGEYAPIDADVTEAEGSGEGFYKYGSSSYEAHFLDTATEDDGFKRTIAGDDLEANESIGLLLYAKDTTIASGDLQILLTDDGGARNYDIGAIPSNVWTWVEVDISGLAAGTGDTITEFGVTLTAQGEAALGAFYLYLDIAYKWDADDEEALGVAILQDGVLSICQATAGTCGAELTDYFVHCESGNDFIVWISDASLKYYLALVAY